MLIRNKIKRIACVQLKSKLPDFCTKVIMPRYGLPVIGAVLDKAGFEVKVFIEHVAHPDRDWILSADIVLLSCLTGAANRTYEFARWVHSEKQIPVVLGGEHGSSFADHALEWVDYVIRGEGDENILDLFKALEGEIPFNKVSGLCYWQNGRKMYNPITKVPANINTVHNLNLIDKYPKEYGIRFFLKHRMAKIICVQSSRGCPFQCRFCVAPRLFGYSYRVRDIEAVIEDIRIKLPYGRNFHFVDNLFAIDIKRTNRLLDRMIEEDFSSKAHFTCFCRVEIYKKPDLLQKMKKAGFRMICLGLESIHNTTLKDLHKKQKLHEMIKAIKTINSTGIKTSGSFIAGNDNDTRISLLQTVDFAIEHKLNSFYFISLWYYPGDPRCPLQSERFIMPDFDYCTGNFVTHFPMKMLPSTLQRTLIDAQKRFWNLKRAAVSVITGNFMHAVHMASHRYAFSLIEKYQEEYAQYLERIEQGYYDKNEQLRLDLISNRPLDPIVKQVSTSPVPGMDCLLQQEEDNNLTKSLLKTW